MRKSDYIWIGLAVPMLLCSFMKLNGYHLDIHLNHEEIEKNSRYKEERDLKHEQERAYLQSPEYFEYRDWCVKNGLDFLKHEKERDAQLGGTFDRDRESRGNLTNRDRD